MSSRAGGAHNEDRVDSLIVHLYWGAMMQVSASIVFNELGLDIIEEYGKRGCCAQNTNPNLPNCTQSFLWSVSPVCGCECTQIWFPCVCRL